MNRQQPSALSAWFSDNFRPIAWFGPFSFYCIIALAEYYVITLHVTGEFVRLHALSIFGWLPDALLSNSLLFKISRSLTLVGLGLWVLNRGTPLIGWVTTFLFAFSVSLTLESSYTLSHNCQALTQILFLYALWHQADGEKITSARSARRFWREPLFPAWLGFACIFTVLIGYTDSGISKLLAVGPQWANGTSLQLWVRIWSDPASFPSRMILYDRRIAEALQMIVLFAECGAIFALFSKALRIAFGLVLVGFHLFAEWTFSFRLSFYSNMILSLIFLIIYTLVILREQKDLRKIGAR